MSDNEIILTLIAKHLQGSATPQEDEQLQHWMQADGAHQQEYDDMVQIWQKSGPLLANPHFNAHLAWQKLDASITASHHQPGVQRNALVVFLSHTKRVAAAILIMVSLAALGYWAYQRTQWQTITAGNNNQTITLPDQSIVLLRKGSILKYPRVFTQKDRPVTLTGEAFFKVQHNEHQPFIISTPNTEVKVLGTSFLVNSTENTDEIVVVTGKVSVKDKHATNNQVLLTPGQRVVLQNDQLYQSEVIDSNFIAWETGRLVFNNATVEKVLQDVSHYYGISLTLAPEAAATSNPLKITVAFDNQPLEQALEEIRLITGLNIKKEKDKIIFYRK